ncbi:MAG: VacB/RNase II family 3'-5' exoribonuclease [Ignavibacteria bacterium]|nr:VacB/RNase II family 3'-5' exoribonuclease [Ignavibacteria bacterium]
MINDGHIKRKGKYFYINTDNYPKYESVNNKITNYDNTSTFNYITGTLKKSKGYYFVVPDSKIIKRNIYIGKINLPNVHPGDKILCKILNINEYENRYTELYGEIIKVFGKAGDKKVELISLIYKYGFEKEFNKVVLTEAEKIERDAKAELKKLKHKYPKEKYKFKEIWDLLDKHEELIKEERIDLRHLECFTIDPEDAKDFDDAISIEEIKSTKENCYLIGVHIADVSHYVLENSNIDLEALKRGTSVYLVNIVAPMLPEKLSNDICSLKQGEDRLTFSVLIKLTKRGNVKGYKIFKSIINNKKRFTYEEAQNIINEGKGTFYNSLLLLNKLAKLLTKKRIKEGAIDFETREAKFILDKNDNVKKIIFQERLDTMRLIEEFMLLANKCVTEYVNELCEIDGKNYPFIYRVHDEPELEKLNDIQEFIKQFGYRVNLKNKSDIKNLVTIIKGKPEEYIINNMLIRAMAKAIYTHKNIGHYGLGFENYTHFTSPIRRYPDLFIHRLLKLYIYERYKISEKEFRHRIRKYTNIIAKVCKVSTQQELQALNAERDAIKLKQVEYLSKFIGFSFEGIISGIVKYGFFVELKEFPAEGLVRFQDITDDYYTFDIRKHCAVGKRKRKIYRAGDTVVVTVLRTDIETRRVDFGINE